MKAILTVLALTAMPALAVLHHTDFADRAIPADSYGIYVNPVTGAVSATVPADHDSASWVNLLFGGTAIGNSAGITLVITEPATGNGDGLVLRLPGAAEIGPALHFTVGANGSENHTGPGAGRFAPGVPGYFGFAVADRYGWLCLTVSDTGAGILHAAAFEDVPGATLSAGAVPEPALPALLATAAAAAALGRRRRA